MKPRLTKEQVRERLGKQAPALLPHVKDDRDWLWYCGPSLQQAPKVRAMLKELGFRFAPNGHPVGTLTGTWGNSCERPTFPRRQQTQCRPGYEQPAANDDVSDYLEIIREMLADAAATSPSR